MSAQPEPLIAMVFDGPDAIDSFDYTAEELRRRADLEDGIGSFTITHASVPVWTFAAGAQR